MPDGTQTCPRCGRTGPADADFCYCGFVFAKPGQRGSIAPVRTTPAPPTAPPAGGGLARQFGQASLAAPLVAFALSWLTRPLAQESRSTAGFLLVVVCALPLFGLVAAVIALAAMSRHGPKGLLLPGVLGLLLNGAIVGSYVWLFLHGR